MPSKQLADKAPRAHRDIKEFKKVGLILVHTGGGKGNQQLLLGLRYELWAGDIKLPEESMKIKKEIIFKHFEVEEEVSPDKRAEIEELLAEMLFKAWLKDRTAPVGQPDVKVSKSS